MEEHNATHRVCYLPLYDVDNSSVSPEYVHRKMDGALVEVHFRIKHFHLKSQLVDSFTGLVYKIKILCPSLPVRVKQHKAAKNRKGTQRVKKALPSRNELLVAANTFLRPRFTSSAARDTPASGLKVHRPFRLIDGSLYSLPNPQPSSLIGPLEENPDDS